MISCYFAAPHKYNEYVKPQKKKTKTKTKTKHNNIYSTLTSREKKNQKYVTLLIYTN